MKTTKSGINPYLEKMRAEKIVQFVCFETPLDSEEFILQWEQFDKSVNSEMDVTLQQSEKNGTFKYIAQHRYVASDTAFAFTKAKKSSRMPEIPIRVKQAGGYSMLQAERNDDARENENKLFAFIIDPTADLDDYKNAAAPGKLNIYEAYYENCQFAYVLEFFVSKNKAASLLEQVRSYHPDEVGIYKDCVLQPA